MAKDDDDKELEVVGDADADEAGETVVVDDEGEDKAKAKAKPDEDERLAAEEDDNEDKDLEELRARRREERKQKKIREREARARTERELNFWRTRGAELEKRFSQLEARNRVDRDGNIDQQIARIEDQIAEADRIIEQGVNTSNGAAVREATSARDKLIEARRNYIDNKETLRQEAEQAQKAEQEQAQPQQQQPPRGEEVDPDVVAHATRWRAANPWYKVDKSNDASVLAANIDRKLAEEGYDASTEEFWEELTKRTRRLVPKSNGAGNGRPSRDETDVPNIANAKREHNLKPGQVYISAERKAAMQAAGVWDNPKERNRFLKSYQEWDANASQNT